jgi:nitroreductase
VIRDLARIRAFGELYHEAWWAKRPDGPGWKTIEDIPKTEKTSLAAAQLADEMGQAPVIVLAFCVWRGDLGHSVLPAVQNLLLAARALGIGSALGRHWVGIGSALTTLHEDVMARVLEMFKVPASVQFHCCIPMGYPRGRFGTTLRRPTSETTYWDDWSNPPPWS